MIERKKTTTTTSTTTNVRELPDPGPSARARARGQTPYETLVEAARLALHVGPESSADEIVEAYRRLQEAQQLAVGHFVNCSPEHVRGWRYTSPLSAMAWFLSQGMRLVRQSESHLAKYAPPPSTLEDRAMAREPARIINLADERRRRRREPTSSTPTKESAT